MDALGDGLDPEVRVDLTDPTSGHDRLVDAEIEHGRRDAVQIGQLDRVEVGQPELSGQALHGQDVGDGVAGTQADHADPERPLTGLLVAGELVAVPVEAEGGEGARGQQPHHGLAPGVVDPSLPLLQHGLARRRLDLGELFQLIG